MTDHPPGVDKIKPTLPLPSLGVWECELTTQMLTWTDGVYDLFDLTRGSAVKRRDTLDFYREESRREMERLRSLAIETGRGFTLDARITTVKGAERWMRLTADVTRRGGHSCRLFGTKQDITHEKALWDRLRTLASNDPLTGLNNRRAFERQFEGLAGQLDASALVVVDVDHMNAINERHGQAAGDECLRQVAARLERAFPEAQITARLGGDRFALLLHVPLGLPHLVRLLSLACSACARPVAWNKSTIAISASFGATLVTPPLQSDLARLTAQAASAVTLAKTSGRGRVRIFGGPVADPTPRQAIDTVQFPRFRIG